MSDVALRMEQVYKKFRKGEVYDSLRDLLPALTGKMFRQQELSKSDTREFWALQDVSFEVKHGEALGIIGRNGAGKSTALKILSRIIKPTKGRMIVDGRLSALIEVAAGFHQDLTGRENIFLYGTILGDRVEGRPDHRFLRNRRVHRHAGEALLLGYVRQVGILCGRACGSGGANRGRGSERG
jgi:ABC-type polysaccharide/polyol phosphate transport system ATPase subunit